MHVCWQGGLVSCLIQQSKHALFVRSLSAVLGKRKPSKLRKDPAIDERLLPVLALIGKPNVGKSALFNRLVQGSEALVKNTPDDHVTRDFREGIGKLGDLVFKVVDTSGLEPFMSTNSIQARATIITMSVLKKANAAVLLIDARGGISHADHDLSRWLKENVPIPLVLTANKAERSRGQGSVLQEVFSEATRLGLGEPVAISAATGEGMADLYQELQGVLDPVYQLKKHEFEQIDRLSIAAEDHIKVAVIGVPNAGKSTLMNRLLGRVRSLTGPEPGLTRDAVADSFVFKGKQIDVVDTAGWLDRVRLKGSELGGDLAETSQIQTLRSFNAAHIVVLIVDALAAASKNTGMTRREIALASDVIKEGRALIIVVNKLDAMPKADWLKALGKVERQLQEQLAEVQGAVCLGVSALTGDGIEQVLPAVLEAFSVWNQRINTSSLNKWLIRTAERYSADSGANQVLRVRYVTQVGTRPPSFVAFVSGSEPFSPASLRFLGKALRQEFGFDGVPLRIDVRLRRKLKQTAIAPIRYRRREKKK